MEAWWSTGGTKGGGTWTASYRKPQRDALISKIISTGKTTEL